MIIPNLKITSRKRDLLTTTDLEAIMPQPLHQIALYL